VTDDTFFWDAANPHVSGNQFNGASSAATNAIGAFAIQSATPEPGTLSLFALALLSVTISGSRKWRA
jgi:hypothetical protein